MSNVWWIKIHEKESESKKHLLAGLRFLLVYSVTCRNIFGTTFSVGGLVNFPQYKRNFIILLCTHLATSFQVYKMFFWTERREAQKFIRRQQFVFPFVIFGDTFLGAYNVWTLLFPIWILPWFSDWFKLLCYWILGIRIKWSYKIFSLAI